MESTSTLSFLLSLLLLAGSTSLAASSPVRTSSTNFIKASCGTTLYPALCVQSLSVYANSIQQSPRQLAQAALSVSLARARSASAFVSKLSRSNGMQPRDLAAMKDCVENMGDSVDRISQSIRELGRVGRSGSGSFQWHVSNVQTWVSAALTDENTCVDGLAGPAKDGNLKAAVKGRVVHVAQVTSNALALVNRFADSDRRSGTRFVDSDRQFGTVRNP
ncbi:21 kDa protein-like [Magnolia sinica]|uniref:21 kDa protein-like n=1 Tax=Magnolia sinica TaxID=86752 RepID=UPI00265B53F7|nr:21 kDa protein-like [Magnolia sinica]